jgi:hypothetical protein
VITFWDVFEHLVNPREVLEKARSLLTDDGLVAIEVPNIRSLYSRLLGRRWWYDFEHVFYYSPRGLLHLLEEAGFSPVLVESDNFNLLTCEGIARLGLLGPDAVWGRTDTDETSRILITIRRMVQRQRSGLVGRMFRGIMRFPNAILNRAVNSFLLGDQLRIFARKKASGSAVGGVARSESSVNLWVAGRRNV